MGLIIGIGHGEARDVLVGIPARRRMHALGDELLCDREFEQIGDAGGRRRR
jgi:hypothetical protein